MILDYQQIGKNLARRRKELRLKQYEVCERAKINDKYLSCIETARSIPSLRSFEIMYRLGNHTGSHSSRYCPSNRLFER